MGAVPASGAAAARHQCRGFDAAKHRAVAVVGDAREALTELDRALAGWTAPADWTAKAKAARASWSEAASRYTAPSNTALPSDAQVIGAVQRASRPSDVLVCAAGGLPGELHKHWQAGAAGGYHLEYGYSTMGYEIAGGLGVKMADPSRDVTVMLGDGSYLMMNSEIATSVLLGLKLTIVVLDNRGFGCIDRLQRSVGARGLQQPARRYAASDPARDRLCRSRAQALARMPRRSPGLGNWSRRWRARQAADRTTVVVIDTDPAASDRCGRILVGRGRARGFRAGCGPRGAHGL